MQRTYIFCCKDMQIHVCAVITWKATSYLCLLYFIFLGSAICILYIEVPCTLEQFSLFFSKIETFLFKVLYFDDNTYSFISSISILQFGIVICKYRIFQIYNKLFRYNQIRNILDDNRVRQVISGTFAYFHG